MRLSTIGRLAPSIAAQRKTEPAQLSKLLRGDLDWIAMKALEKDRKRRYETANGFAADVLRYLNDEPVEASPAVGRLSFTEICTEASHAGDRPVSPPGHLAAGDCRNHLGTR